MDHACDPSHSPFARLTRIEDLTRREFISSALAAALLIACGDDDDPPALGGPETRTISNDFGTYQVPGNPQRLVVMDNRDALETAVALGIVPAVIGQRFSFAGGRVEYAAPWVPLEARETEVFNGREPDLEFILGLDPDLILADSSRFEGGPTYEQLSEIAPVVPLNREKPWRDGLVEIAGWLGRDDNVAKTLAEYDALRDSIAAKHSRALPSARVAFGSFEDQTIWLADLGARELPASEALKDLGGQPFEAAVAPDPGFPGWRSFSVEALELVQDADALFLWAPDTEQRDELLAHPLWQLLPVVQSGRALVSTNNVGSGSIYTVMECLRLWDEVFTSLA